MPGRRRLTINKKIQAAIDDTEKAIENLWNALEQGQSVQKITERINMREAEKRELQKQLAMEQRKKLGLTTFTFLHIWITSEAYQTKTLSRKRHLSIYL